MNSFMLSRYARPKRRFIPRRASKGRGMVQEALARKLCVSNFRTQQLDYWRPLGCTNDYQWWRRSCQCGRDISASNGYLWRLWFYSILQCGHDWYLSTCRAASATNEDFGGAEACAGAEARRTEEINLWPAPNQESARHQAENLSRQAHSHLSKCITLVGS